MLVVVPLLAQLDAPPEARVILTVETSLGDLLSAVVVTTASGMIVAGSTPASGALLLAMRFLVGGAVGVLVGVGWARLLHAGRIEKHAFPLTLAALMVLYAVTEMLGGSGFLAALAFGLFLGNAGALTRLGGLRDLAPLPATSRGPQSELIFLLRSVYFVFLGLSIPRNLLTPRFALVALVLVAAIVAARAIGVFATASRSRSRGLLFAMMPRGLATAVIASIPVSMGVPGAELFPAYCFGVILAADFATSAALWVYLRARPASNALPVAAPH
jgi:cell volume regulation protein A